MTNERNEWGEEKESFTNILSLQLRRCNSEKLNKFHCYNLYYNFNPGVRDYKTHVSPHPWPIISGCVQEEYKHSMLYNHPQINTWQATWFTLWNWHNSDSSMEIEYHLRSRPNAETLLRNNNLALGGLIWGYGTGRKFWVRIQGNSQRVGI